MSRRKKTPPKAAVELTRRAIGDLLEIERYSVSEWGRKAADSYLNDIALALDRLSGNPEILRLEPEFSSGLYFYRVKKHFLVCDVFNESIIVLAVVHTSMNLPARLLELEPRLVAESEIFRSKVRPMPDTE